jgi:hypothetical protein
MSYSTIKTVEDACRVMLENTHAFLTVEGAAHILRPFHLDGHVSEFCREYEADGDHNPKGLTLANGASKAYGVAMFDLARLICIEINLDYATCLGRGFQVRACCDTIRKHYGEARFT